MASAGLKTHIWNNNLRSLLLLGLYPVFLIGLVWLIAAAAFGALAGPGMVTAVDRVHQANAVITAYWPSIAAIVAIWFTIAWFFHARMVRMLSHGHPVTRQEEPELYNMLENLCISRGIAMPRLEIIESPALNAFASGINDKTYSITVTRGLLNTLQPDEVEAVLGHELTHIINHDVRLLMICIIFTGMIGFAAQMIWNMARNGMHISTSRGRNGGVLFLIVSVIIGLGYLASMMTRFALSRTREYMADAGSVELTQNPEAMMRALMRIGGHDRVPGMTADIALMCIENSRPFLGLFTTHPPIDARIRAIAATTRSDIPVLGAEDPLPDGKTDWIGLSRNGMKRNPWA